MAIQLTGIVCIAVFGYIQYRKNPKVFQSKKKKTVYALFRFMFGFLSSEELLVRTTMHSTKYKVKGISDSC